MGIGEIIDLVVRGVPALLTIIKAVGLLTHRADCNTADALDDLANGYKRAVSGDGVDELHRVQKRITTVGNPPDLV